MLGFLKKAKKQVCVIGLDGVPYSLVQTFVKDGTMPVMGDLVAEGHLHRMKVTLPEISAVSWTSFMTGAGPGEHGIYGFMDLKSTGKDLRFPSFRDVKVPTFWDRLGEKGKKCIVVNQPSTYPARPIPGILVSGFVALDLRKAVFPAKWFVELKRMNYELDIDTQRARVDTNYLIQSLDATLEGRRAVLDRLWDKEEWDYFQIVITGTDRLQHYLWDAIEDVDHPHHEAVRQYYKKVDSFIGEIVDRFQKKTSKEQALSNLLLLSDHGFTGIKKEFNLNAWLRESGYQSVSGTDMQSLEALSKDTKAFALDPNRIYFNRKDRFQDGIVDPGEVSALCDRIEQELGSVRCDGEPVVQRVFRRSEVYAGAQESHGPDLIALTHYGYDAKGTLAKDQVFTETDLKGMHTWDDAFFWSVGERGNDLKIIELASIIENAFAG